MIQDDESPKQPPSVTPLTPPTLRLAFPPVCPTCGRPTFDLLTSGLLDLVLLAQDALADVQAALEKEALP